MSGRDLSRWSQLGPGGARAIIAGAAEACGVLLPTELLPPLLVPWPRPSAPPDRLTTNGEKWVEAGLVLDQNRLGGAIMPRGLAIASFNSRPEFGAGRPEAAIGVEGDTKRVDVGRAADSRNGDSLSTEVGDMISVLKERSATFAAEFPVWPGVRKGS